MRADKREAAGPEPEAPSAATPDALLLPRRPQPEEMPEDGAAAEPDLEPAQPRRARRASDAASPDRAETPPAIQVSIGRVEVRAVLPPAPAPPAAAPAWTPPRLSLDDYLKQQRDGGRQR